MVVRSTFKEFLPLLFVLGLSFALITSCSQGPPEPVTFEVEMTEFAFVPDTLEARVGQEVTINLVNHGALEHEMVFGRNVALANGLPSGYEVDMFSQAGVEPAIDEMMVASEEGMGEGEHTDEAGHGHEHDHEHEGFMFSVPPSSGTGTIKFTVTEAMIGEWEIGCFLQDGVHYAAGMVGKLIVSK